eukprot:gene11764-12981_t
MEINPGILIGNIRYTKITASVNGLIYLGMRYMAPDYTPDMLSGYEIMAPYWSDIDMRGSSGGIAYSQHRNSDTDSFSQTIMNETSSYISARTNVNFSPTLVILVTWIKGFPYPSSSYVNTNETATFQLNLATNNHSTYASFIYEDGAMLWKYTSKTPHVGFSLNKNILDLVLGETGIPSYRFDTVVGNTGNASKFSAAHGIGVGLGVAGLIVISVAVAVIYKRREQNQGDITKHVKPVSNEKFEMEA